MEQYVYQGDNKHYFATTLHNSLDWGEEGEEVLPL